MKDVIESKYNLKINTIIKLSDKTYKLLCDEGEYVLKYHKSDDLESIFSRLYLINIDVFLLPIKSFNEQFIENNESLYFAVYPFLKDEVILSKDIRLKLYVKAIANLHLYSQYNIKLNEVFLNESIEYLTSQLEKKELLIDTRIERIEKEQYHSPSEWYFIMNYDHFKKAIEFAREKIDSLSESFKSEKNINVSLTYQNLNYNHILVKQNKIISLDKMTLAPSLYDIIELFNVVINSKIDFIPLLKEYLDINPMEQYEKNWLLAFLFIPLLDFKSDDLHDIDNQFKALYRISNAEEVATFFDGESGENS